MLLSFCVSGSHYRLVTLLCSGLAVIEHDRYADLPGPLGCLIGRWSPLYLQGRPGLPVHQQGLDRPVTC